MWSNFKLLLHYKWLLRSIFISTGVSQILLELAHDHAIFFFFWLLFSVLWMLVKEANYSALQRYHKDKIFEFSKITNATWTKKKKKEKFISRIPRTVVIKMLDISNIWEIGYWNWHCLYKTWFFCSYTHELNICINTNF